MIAIKLVSTCEPDESLKNDLKEQGFAFLKKNSMLGGDAVWTVIGAISTATIGAITKIVVEAIKSKSLIEISIGDKKIKAAGLSKEAAERIINESLKND